MSVRRNQRRPDGGVVTQRHVQGWGVSEVIRYPLGHVPVAPTPGPVEIIVLPPDRPAKPSRIRPSLRSLIAHAEENDTSKGTSMVLTVSDTESTTPRLSRAQATYDRVETECYTLAAERWGKGSAVSLDTETGGFVARAWKPTGELGLAGDGGQRTKLAALRKLKKRLMETAIAVER